MVDYKRYCTKEEREVTASDCYRCELAEVCQGIPSKEVRRDVVNPV